MRCARVNSNPAVAGTAAGRRRVGIALLALWPLLIWRVAVAASVVDQGAGSAGESALAALGRRIFFDQSLIDARTKTYPYDENKDPHVTRMT